MEHLEVLISDMLEEARELLSTNARTEGDRTVGVELDPEPKVTILHVVDDVTPPRVVWRALGKVRHADLLTAAGTLAASWMGALPESDRRVYGQAVNHGSPLRIYARPDTEEVALAILLGNDIKEIARRVIALKSTAH